MPMRSGRNGLEMARALASAFSAMPSNDSAHPPQPGFREPLLNPAPQPADGFDNLFRVEVVGTRGQIPKQAESVKRRMRVLDMAA